MKEPNYNPVPKWTIKNDNDISKNQENRVRKKISKIDKRARNTPASGSKAIKGDVQGEFLLAECKVTSKQSISVSVDWLSKVESQAIAQGKKPALFFGFDNAGSSFRRRAGEELQSNAWVAITDDFFMELLGAWVKTKR